MVLSRYDREDALRLAKWRSIRSAPKDREIDIWFSEPGIGYRPNARWSRTEKNWCWHGAAPPDREWCIEQMPNIRPTHWTPCLNLDSQSQSTGSVR
jgi:hypothetical protein